MLKPPSWNPTAKPTTRGWIDGITGELLISRKHSERQVMEYYLRKEIEPMDTSNLSVIQEPAPIIEADPIIEESVDTAELLVESTPMPNLYDMTKAQLVDYVRGHYGVTLDAKKTKAVLVEEAYSTIVEEVKSL